MKIVQGLIAGALAIGAAVSLAPVASAAPSSRSTVNAWYHDFLSRDGASDTGSDYWVLQLDAPRRGSDTTNAADLAYRLITSRESAQRVVSGYYTRYLNRAPDPGALYWVNGVSGQQFPLEWAQQNILASEEFDRRNYDRSSTVQSWYSYVLGRSNVTDGEVAYWVGRTNSVGRLNALREIWYSPEAVRYRINEHYKDLLHRGADLDGVGYWSSFEIQSDDRLQALLAGTQEYAVYNDFR